MRMIFIKLIKRIRKIFKLKQVSPFVCVAIGDSTVEGIGASSPHHTFTSLVFKSVKERVRHARLHNFGKSGARIGDVLTQQIDKAIKLRPNLVLISVGGNDILHLTSLQKFDAKFKLLIEKLTQETEALLVINNIPDMSIAPAVPSIFSLLVKLQVKRFNGRIIKYTKSTRGIFIDLYSHSNLLKGFKEFVAIDGFHPSDIGYAVWASLIIAKIIPTITSS